MTLYIDADTHYLPLQWLDHVDSPAARDWIQYEKAGTRINVLRQGAPLISMVGSSRVDLQACKLEYSIVSPK